MTVIQKICSLSLQIKKKAKELNIDYRLLEKKKHPLGWLIAGMIGIIVTFPLFIYGNIFNLTFLEIPNLQIPKNKRSSVPFISQIWYFTCSGICFPASISDSFTYNFFSLVAWITYFSYPSPFRLFAWNYYLQFQKNIGGFKDKKLIINKDREFDLLRKNHKELVNLVAEL